MANREPTLGEYLYQARQERGWSLREAAKRVESLTHSRIDEIEKMRDARTGKYFVPSYINVIRLAKAYDLPVDDLLRRAGYEPGIELTPDEWEIVGLYRQLDPAGRERARTALKGLREGPSSGESPPET